MAPKFRIALPLGTGKERHGQAGSKRTVAAARHFRQARDLDPDSAVFHRNLGPVLPPLCALKEAAACFCEALGWEPAFVEASNNRARFPNNRASIGSPTKH